MVDPLLEPHAVIDLNVSDADAVGLGRYKGRYYLNTVNFGLGGDAGIMNMTVRRIETEDELL
jgi:hypothetical protein